MVPAGDGVGHRLISVSIGAGTTRGMVGTTLGGAEDITTTIHHGAHRHTT